MVEFLNKLTILLGASEQDTALGRFKSFSRGPVVFGNNRTQIR